jgi:hypothetical protein
MFWACVTAPKKYSSSGLDFGAYLSSEVIRSIWGRYENMTAAVGHRYFGVVSGDNLSHRCNLYYPHPDLVIAFKSAIRVSEPLSVLDVENDARVRRGDRLPVSWRTSTGGRRVGRGQPADSLPIRRDELRRLLDSRLRPDCQRSLYRLLALSQCSRNPSELPVRYMQYADTGGRLYEQNHLQETTRHIRSVALAGLWDYDISNCHFSLIATLAEERGLGVPVIKDYLANKCARRTELQTTLQRSATGAVAAGDVKSAIIAVAYGMPLSRSSPALAKIFKSPAVVAAFTANPWVRGLRRELSVCRTNILGAYRTKAGTYRITNAVGCRRSFALKDANKALSFLIMGMESLALEVVLRRWGQSIVLCIHDGWVSRDRIPVGDIEWEVYRKTGWRLTIEQSLIEPMPLHRCQGCVEREHHVNRSHHQGLTGGQSLYGETNRGTTPSVMDHSSRVAGGTTATVHCADDGSRSSADPLFDADFRGSGLYITRRPQWNVSKLFRGGAARSGRPRGSRKKEGVLSGKSVEQLPE